ncbi:glycosyltransferase [Pelagibacteraceae bacterium]|jgi:glycosyltransferase involved in cell wall biosynthesis|nr:glycosyltransferase [Pelagibacteraceae bacterium]MDC0418913.1 glycosyltransferase [Pelagibacteraceae bacterium]
MRNKPLIIVCNEKVSVDEENNFFCINADLQIVPDGLSKFFDIHCIFRNLKKKGNHKFNFTKKIKIASNIFIFIKNLIKTLSLKDSKYLIITITPYSFISFLILRIFKKNIFVYLMSSGHDEWRYILGPWSVWIYDLMFRIVTKNSKVIVCHKRLYDEKKSFLVKPARLTQIWSENKKKSILDKARYLYVGRFNPEKGIANFIELFNTLEIDVELSIAGEQKKIKISEKNKINQLGYISDEKLLIDTYDAHNIVILPSFTEAHPYVVDEALSREKPVVIFEDISYVKGNKYGIFIIKRNLQELKNITEYILSNYDKVQEDMKKNNLPSREKMLLAFKDIIDLN